MAWDSSLQSGMARSWDTPAKLGHPSQTGTTQPKWDSPPISPPTWDVPHRVGRLNRLGRPMKEWDDSAVGHPTPSPGHTTQAGTSHTNWSIPFFPRLLSTVRCTCIARARGVLLRGRAARGRARVPSRACARPPRPDQHVTPRPCSWWGPRSTGCAGTGVATGLLG